jgi:hypothetical protein
MFLMGRVAVMIGWIALAAGGLLGLAFIDACWLMVAVAVLAIAAASSWWLGRHERRLISRQIEAEQQQSEIVDEVFDEHRLKGRQTQRAGGPLHLPVYRGQQPIRATRRRRTANFGIYTQIMPAAATARAPDRVAGRAGGQPKRRRRDRLQRPAQPLRDGGTRIPMWYLEVAAAWPWGSSRSMIAHGAHPVERPANLRSTGERVQMADRPCCVRKTEGFLRTRRGSQASACDGSP